jgi:4-diphosphocytidyl-2C-methyl-D-erythritol kinase
MDREVIRSHVREAQEYLSLIYWLSTKQVFQWYRVEHSFLKNPLAQIDLAPHVNASLEVMDRDSKIMRGNGPTIFTSVKEEKGVDDVLALVLAAWRGAGSPGLAEPVGGEKV